ncbi:MAG TPA: hypothetical protein VK559_00465 [Ferruginibacter sp.]|nr:hypothetical protein [Ferruginibacter sp.]
MKYLPFENYTLLTKLSSEEIKKRLAENLVAKRKGLSFLSLDNRAIRPYEGEIIEDTFSINRIINYRNSFLPMITGSISKPYGKTEIAIKMRPALFTLIFIAFWLGIVGMVCIAILIIGIIKISSIHLSEISPLLLIPFGMFIFGCALSIIPFKIESKKSKEFLQLLFQAEEADVDIS